MADMMHTSCLIKRCNRTGAQALSKARMDKPDRPPGSGTRKHTADHFTALISLGQNEIRIKGVGQKADLFRPDVRANTLNTGIGQNESVLACPTDSDDATRI